MGMALYGCVELQSLAVDTAAWALKSSENEHVFKHLGVSGGLTTEARQRRWSRLRGMVFFVLVAALHLPLICVRWSLLVEAG